MDKLSHGENIRIPENFDFHNVLGLRNEAKQKLAKANPQNLGQASRISGVSPADISVLMIALMRAQRGRAQTVDLEEACSDDEFPPSC